MRWPVRSWNSAKVDGKSGAEPEMNTRTPDAVSRVKAGLARRRV
jgi:hypothetical protein